jgi:hypothetical protein
MSRIKISTQMIDYLEKRINCENVIKYAKQQLDQVDERKNIAEINKLVINNLPVSFEILNYSKTNNLSPKKIFNDIYKMYDFMVEANHTGFEYFPYIYGVLDCHEESNGQVYVYREYFPENLTDTFKKINHVSEWYDIVFQILMINHYIVDINKIYYTGGDMSNHLCKKLDKPYYKNYEFGDKTIKINHKYLIVLWNINKINTNIDDDKFTSNIDYLLKYLTEHGDQISIPPSPKILKMLNSINQNPDKIIELIINFYSP